MTAPSSIARRSLARRIAELLDAFVGKPPATWQLEPVRAALDDLEDGCCLEGESAISKAERPDLYYRVGVTVHDLGRRPPVGDDPIVSLPIAGG